MNERLKELRKALNMTMEAFGQRLGVTKATISMIEHGQNMLTDRNINIICKEFHVNEEWLRSGEGDMFIRLSRDEEIAAFVGSVQFEADDSFKKRFIAMLSALDTEDWKVLEKMAMKIYEERKEKDG